MALQVNFTEGTGVAHPTSYWQLTLLEIDLGNFQIRIYLDGWHTQADNAAAKDTIGRKEVAITDPTAYSNALSILVNHTQSVQDLAYAYVKANDAFFTGATDV